LPTANLPSDCAIDALAEGLSTAGALGDAKSTVLFLPPHAHLKPSALTFLCAWGRAYLDEGRTILIRGDTQAESELARLELHEHLGLAHQKTKQAPRGNPVVPLRLISDESDIIPVWIAISELVSTHFEQAETFLPALEWAVNELFDNVLRHADAELAGAAYCEYDAPRHRLNVAICDMGRGIYDSLSESEYLYSPGHAITQAIKRGVTRSEDIGQGNGLAGVVEIVSRNLGDLTIWTGDAVFKIRGGINEGFALIPEIPGTGVSFSLDTHNPVDLGDTWIASYDYDDEDDVMAPTETVAGTEVSDETDSADPEKECLIVLDVAAECASTGMRGPAKELRERILVQLAIGADTLILDFSTVERATSSFLDELLGRLAKSLGLDVYRKKIQVRGMSDLVERMAGVVIRQRLGGIDGQTREQS
jgi:hypothetical protein